MNIHEDDILFPNHAQECARIVVNVNETLLPGSMMDGRVVFADGDYRGVYFSRDDRELSDEVNFAVRQIQREDSSAIIRARSMTESELHSLRRAALLGIDESLATLYRPPMHEGESDV